LANDLNILVAESSGFPASAADELRRLGHLTLADLDRDGLLDRVGDIDVLWVRLRHFIGPEVLQKGGRLRWIASPTTGLTHIDLESAGRRGIGVLSLRGQVTFLENVRATAEFTIALMLSLLRNLPEALRHVNLGGWDRDSFRGGELYQRTIGIVGYGRLGKLVGHYLLAFGARVMATDCRTVDAEPGIVVKGLFEVLRDADIVSLHADFRETNRSFFDRDCLAAMKPGSLFINTARGELVDESALLEALESGHLGGAALDVLSDEHRADKKDNPLLRFAGKNPNLLITPHIGGCTAESMAKAECHLARILIEAISRQSNSLDPAATPSSQPSAPSLNSQG
jgi:D-3-phosphoglycerate dehydrogenase / 2-oxoglutarate reductase